MGWDQDEDAAGEDAAGEAAMVSWRVWSAILTGLDRHITGSCSAYSRAEANRPGTGRRGRQGRTVAGRQSARPGDPGTRLSCCYDLPYGIKAVLGRQHLDGFSGRPYRRNRTAAAFPLKRALVDSNSKTTYLANVETPQ